MKGGDASADTTVTGSPGDGGDAVTPATSRIEESPANAPSTPEPSPTNSGAMLL